jgi:CBS-domain-containing membrane protein
MLDLCKFMLGKVSSMFRIKTEDPGSLAMRLGKVSDEKGEWFQTPVKAVANLGGRNPWRPVRRSYTVLDASMVLGTGVYRLPLLDEKDRTESLLSQSKLMAIFNTDANNRLGKMKMMTAQELGAEKPVVTVNVDSLAMKAFETIDEQNVSAVAIVDDEGKLVGQVDADSLKLIGVQFSMLAKPLWEVWEINGVPMSRWNTTDLHQTRTDAPVEVRGTCTLQSTMQEMVQTVVAGHFRRLWLVDETGKPTGVVSLTDLIKSVIDRMSIENISAY